MKHLNELYSQFRSRPFPKLGKVIGDFGMFDGVFSGFFSRVIGGQLAKEDEVPNADDETLAFVESLRNKHTLDSDEKEFLEYVDLMEQIVQLYAGRSSR